MSFKPVKSRTLVSKKIRVLNKICFSISGSQIPTILEQLVKSLGKTLNNRATEIPYKSRTPAKIWSGG